MIATITTEYEYFIWTADENQTEDPEWIVKRLQSGDAKFIDEGTPEITMSLCRQDGGVPLVANRGDYLVLSDGDVIPYSAEEFHKHFTVQS